MPLETIFKNGDVALTAAEQARIQRHLRALERRLSHHSEPTAVIALKPHPWQQVIQADLTVQLGHLGQHLVSHQAAKAADVAVRLAVVDVERQLERQLAKQAGDHTYGVPSRRRGVSRRQRLEEPPPEHEAGK